ncbi:DUF4180 domain-containing protein [Nitratireductor soli]|uniref:DUF4180 domain-containing protein n=1 Tax=Nitratireductor soli TaxID=1670619 RepID=UPI00065E3D14|nr:DUF4180 domain-containing protein [Nitratireductor soli]
MRFYEIGGINIGELAADGPPIAREADVNDIIGACYGTPTDLVIVPVSRLSADFFNLRTRLAGAVVQKFVTYRLRVAFLGDISAAVATSAALGDFVRESNKGGQVLFVDDHDALKAMLAA